MFRVLAGVGVAAVIVAVSVAQPLAQSQAVNGTIEGTITDQSGAALPGVSVTVSNVDTGDTRVVVSNDAGVYRAPLLSLGRYRVSAELQGFKNSSSRA
jgi:hypothetical protein